MANRKSKSRIPSKLVPDFGLWVRATKSFNPIDPNLARELEKFKPVEDAHSRNPVISRVSPETLKNGTTRPRNSGSLEFTGLARRQQQKFLRGQVEVEARIDLHGESLLGARVKLLNFLTVSAKKGIRTVLVITGKGSSDFTRHTLHSREIVESSSRTGRLREALPDWFHEPEFRVLVSGFQPAHPKHGGGGAMYVRLRNPNKKMSPG